MSQKPRNKIIRAELDQLTREGLIDTTVHKNIAQLYPLTKWNWTSLSRWFLIFGAVSAVAGAAILLKDIFEFSFQKLAILLGIVMVVLFAGAFVLRQKGFGRTAASAELLAGFALIGLSFTLGIIYSTGSGNWPALLLIDLILLVPLTYGLNNSLLLILSGVVFFVWFGGRTGYESGWGMYWFGMNYPLRFFGAAVVFCTMGFGHMMMESGFLSRYRGFAKIWISLGLFLLEMALWLLSLFGNFGDMMEFRFAPNEELVLFNVVWLVVNIALVYLGSRWRFGMLTGYGVTFFIIQLYTLFFAHVAESLGWVFSMFVAGGTALVLALYLESRLRTLVKNIKPLSNTSSPAESEG
jgi:Predicted membrane protein (DUF2157)